MRLRLRLPILALCAGLALPPLTPAPALAFADNKFFDPVTQEWVELKVTPEVAGKIARRKFKRKVVDFNGPEAPGTIIVDTEARALYHVLEGGEAMRYGIGVGRDGFTWQGVQKVTRKAEWPGWTPPPEMIARERKKGRKLPAFMPGGPNNPMGARALYLGNTIYRIHGTNEDWSIGQAVSSGCFRMWNDDVEHLYSQVPVGATVIIR
ncbi:L,D-transpeptidase family protein [Microvirga tunisiensis]|uniref:L,D-transpeptidase family protein n=2 Tax=Pannonibacter tanglangensis TaxID=2750084 RepID=A0A7X5F8N9_9HYPH|nr:MULTISPECIES: L,D-transpeptidase [unclassified Pannonibacter]NBN66019.1 L,D-transpeptidase family protein [Pannonibacter sp. XCT-34]NBN80514.1 L,D-transpeptidase family protein [Pannonibacter sp. XCT-53]